MRIERPTDEPQSNQTSVYWCITYLPDSFTHKQYVFGLRRDATFKDLSQRIVHETGSDIWNEYSYSPGNDVHHNNVLINSDESMELAIKFMGDDAFDPSRGILVFVNTSW
ncbi:hypothetical protein INT47_005197 [Mucor saturninus]|uniref:Uncharacterized protein n=1 Tax=Mucor saturninus TaxID=64648 RepID=A0A8H7UZA8_9FUNG|nr:hypothetical protein INT47_005197 [Mucor saturninus]